jgi:hypothetical protein
MICYERNSGYMLVVRVFCWCGIMIHDRIMIIYSVYLKVHNYKHKKCEKHAKIHESLFKFVAIINRDMG